MKITFLGTGPSLGTPIIGCNCEVCTSIDPRDKRLRSSVMVDVDGKRILIDAGPDFREQMLRYNTEFKLDAILLTHSHRDHVAGLDDVRPFNFLLKRSTIIYAENNVLEEVKKRFFYSFDKKSTNQGVPKFDLREITTEPFFIDRTKIIPIRVFHSMDMLGFRIKDFTYITDAKIISDEEIEKIKGSKILVVNAIRRKLHYSHFNLDEALELISKIKPEQAYITHMAHKLEKHEVLNNLLPENIQPAYDGLSIEL